MLQEIIAEPEMRSLHNLNLYSEIFYSNVIVDAVNMFQNPLFIRTFSHLSYRASHSEPLEIPTSHKVSVLSSLWKIKSSPGQPLNKRPHLLLQKQTQLTL